jgi:hypothetical protein
MRHFLKRFSQRRRGTAKDAKKTQKVRRFEMAGRHSFMRAAAVLELMVCCGLFG